MKKRMQIVASMGVLVLIAGGAVPAAAAPSAPHVSGGVGIGEREDLLAREGDYNFKVVTAERSGAFLAGVHVVIEGAGGERVLDTEMQGPLLLARLAPGSYTMRAVLGGEVLTRTVVIPEHGRREALLHWPARE